MSAEEHTHKKEKIGIKRKERIYMIDFSFSKRIINDTILTWDNSDRKINRPSFFLMEVILENLIIDFIQ